MDTWANIKELLDHLFYDHRWSGDDPRWMQSKAKLEEIHQNEHETGFPHEHPSE